MKGMLKSLRLFFLLTLVTGFIYPLLVTAIAQIGFVEKAKGDLTLIGQKFEGESYFWGRPSAVDYNPLPSGGSNLGPTSTVLKLAVEKRKSKYTHTPVPSELLFASGSGLDPHITPEAALFQIERVAKARNFKEEDLRKIIEENTEGRFLGFIGQPRVNVLKLNRALDKSSAKF